MFYPICLVYTFTNYSSKICLEDNTERSESNPGRSLGIKNGRKELSGRQYQHKQNLRAHRYATTTNVQNLSRITLMRRICSFHGFFSFGFICACRALGSSRIYLSLWTICGLLLLYAIQRRTGANTIRRKSKTK